MLRCGWCGLYLFKQAALSEEYPEETWREMEGFNMTQLIAEVNNLVSYSISILENKAKYMVHLQRVAKVVPRLVGIVENSFGALDFEKSCLFVKRIGNA
jgi:steroid 5-alpha reductase family enzyme